MQAKPRPARLGRRGKIFITLFVIFGTLALLLYFEQLAVIYIGSALALIVLLIVVAFSDLENIGIQAVEEAYRNRLPERDSPSEGAVTEMRAKERVDVDGPNSRRLARHDSKEKERIY